MTGVVITSLPTASTLTGAEYVPVVQSGTTVKTTIANMGPVGTFTQSGTGAVTTTVQSKLQNIMQVNDFVSSGSGTLSDPWVGWDTNIIWSEYTQYNFIDGYYAYSSSPNFAKNFLTLNGSAGTRLKHTGSGYALLCDAGSGSQLVISVSIRNIILEGNASSTGGVYQRACIHSDFKIKFYNVPNICFTDIFSVLNTYTLETTSLVTGETIQSAYLLSIDKRSAGEESSANKYYLIAENCSAQGVVLNDCVNSTFIGGTSESNAGGGYFISSTSNYNTFINIDLESNTGYDISCLGSYNTFINTLSTGTTTISGNHNVLQGGVYNTINASGAQNSFGPLGYSNNAGGFSDTGTGNTKFNVFNMTSSIMDLDVLSPVNNLNASSVIASHFNTSNGTVSATNATATTLFNIASAGRYDVIAYISSGDAANYTASATVLNEGAGSSRIIANNGGLLTLTLSGNTVKATQSSGATQSIQYSYIRIA